MEGSSLYELKIHELKFSIKKLQIHKKIHLEAAEQFSKYFKEYVESIEDGNKKHKLKQVAGLAGESEKRSTKTARRAKQQAQYRKGKTQVEPQAEQQQASEQPRVEHVKKEIPKEYKKLYRKLAALTHPDRSTDKDPKKFQEINSAINDENYFKLVEVALEMEIDIPEEVPLATGDLENRITENNKLIKQMTKSIAWEWYHIKEEEIRKSLIVKYATYLLGTT